MLRMIQGSFPKFFFEIYRMQFLLGLVMSVLYLGYCFFIARDRALAFIFLLLVISGGIDLTWMLYGLEEFKAASIRDVTTKLITALCIFLFVKKADDVWKYALIYSLGFFITQLVVIPLIRKRVFYIRPEWANVVSHIKPNLFLFLPTVAVSIYRTMDKIMLGTLSSDVELGYYHSAENVIRVPLALVTALGTVMLPRMSNMLSNNESEGRIKDVFTKSIMFAVFVTSSTCLGIMTVAKEFVPIFYGEGFDKCVDLFYVVLPSCIFVAFANVIRTQYLLPRKRDALYVLSLFIGAIVNVVLNLLMIPYYASIGAAIGTLAAEVVVCVVQSVCVFKEANIGRNIINSLPFVIAGIIMFVACRNFVPPIGNAIVALLIKIIISGMLYLAVLGVFILIKRAVVSHRLS